MSGELVLPPEPSAYFDGLLCPLCGSEYLGEPFGYISSRMASTRLLDIPTQCRQERLIGLVLYPDAPSLFYYQPDRCLLREESNFHCTVCRRNANRHGDFLSVNSLPGNTRRYRYTCSGCRNETKIRMIVRRLAEDPLPNVLSVEDRPPIQAIHAGLPTHNEILDVHDVLVALVAVNFGPITEKRTGPRR